MADNDSKPNGQNRERLGNVPTAPVTFVRKPKPFDREAAMRAYEREHPEAVETRMRALRERHAGTSLRIFPSDPKKFFEAGFSKILATRMAGLPIVNTALAVAATEFVRIRIDDTQAWLGVVVTPWAVMGILAPATREGWRFIPAGGFEEIELAAGTFRFIACADAILGHYRSLSLKSPVFEFQDMASAKAFADACLNLLLGRQTLEEEPEEQNPTLSPKEPEPEPIKENLTRRELLGRYAQPLTQSSEKETQHNSQQTQSNVAENGQHGSKP